MFIARSAGGSKHISPRDGASSDPEQMRFPRAFTSSCRAFRPIGTMNDFGRLAADAQSDTAVRVKPCKKIRFLKDRDGRGRVHAAMLGSSSVSVGNRITVELTQGKDFVQGVPYYFRASGGMHCLCTPCVRFLMQNASERSFCS